MKNEKQKIANVSFVAGLFTGATITLAILDIIGIL